MIPHLRSSENKQLVGHTVVLSIHYSTDSPTAIRLMIYQSVFNEYTR